jgi:arylsulfatase A-like enzyme
MTARKAASKPVRNAAASAARPPNLILFGMDSLRTDHMSLFGYDKLTTPHLDKFIAQGAAFSHCFSPSVPTTPGYSSMFTGMDVFGTDVVALRHKGPLGDHVSTLAEVLGKQGYTTVCVGFSGNPASRGFQKYVDFPGWGSWETGRSPKAENLNVATIPVLRELVDSGKPFFLFMRHMDPHSPYLPPLPFERLFYSGNECDPQNRSLDPVYAFKPFCDYFASWFPPGCTDKDYVCAQYDGAIAYMDAAIGNLLTEMKRLGLEKNTLTVFDSDHGETLYDHDCYFDHHSIYDNVLRVPLAFVMPGRVPAGFRNDSLCQLKDVMPTILDLLGIESRIAFDGRSLAPLLAGGERAVESEFYITECTWMRKHGWRTPQWKLMQALEPDFHFKPKVELYDLVRDPGEDHNLAEQEPAVVKLLQARMLAHIAKREKETGRRDPIYTNLGWHGHGDKPFKSSQQAYDTLHIGSPQAAQKLQAQLKELQTQRGAAKL